MSTESKADAPESSASQLILRFRRWLAWGVALAALLYLGLSIAFTDLGSVASAFARFSWPLYLAVLGLTLINYGLRFWKWHFLLGRLGVQISAREDLVIFGSGLAMVISPGKAGELLKPWLVRMKSGVAMTHTVPALVTERLTDGIAVLILAAISVTTYAGDKVEYVAIPIGLCVVGLGVLMNERVSLAILGILRQLPMISKVGDKLLDMYRAMRVCVAPLPLAATLTASLIAWGAECVGYMLIFRGFGVEASLDVSTFLYAFATVAGGAMPGGLGVADGALVGGALKLVPGVSEPVAVAASLLIRGATLWFGVMIGAFAVLRASKILDEAASRTPRSEP